MSNADRKRQLKEAYKTRKVTGGVYRIRNTETGRYYLQSSDDIAATHNWWNFCLQMNNCSLPPIQRDWNRLGAEGFRLEELDLIEKGEDQTLQEFQQDVKVLFDMWDEKLRGEDRY